MCINLFVCLFIFMAQLEQYKAPQSVSVVSVYLPYIAVVKAA